MPSLNTENAILSNAIKVNSSYNVGIGGAASGGFKLNVTGTSNFTGALTASAGSLIPSIIAIGSGNGNGIIQLSNSSNYTIGAGTDYGGMEVRVGGSPRILILNNGNVGINQSNPTFLLDVNGTARVVGAATFSSSVTAGGATAIADSLLPIQINAATSSQAYFASNNNGGYGLLMGYDNANGYARIRNVSNTALTFETNNVERMRITNGGNVGINTNAPTDYGGYTTFHVNGKSGSGSGVLRVTAFDGTAGFNIYADNAAKLNTTSAIPIIFQTQDTERMRIGSDGRVFIGIAGSSNGHKLEINSGSTSAIRVDVTSGTSGLSMSPGATFGIDRPGVGGGTFLINSVGAIKLNTADYGNVYNFSWKGVIGGIDNFAAIGAAQNGYNVINFFNGSNTYVASIAVEASSVTYGTGSDYRLKEDFKDFNGLEKVSAIKVYDFKFKEEGDRMEGVIAHELQEIVPYAVTGYKDEVDKDGNAKIQNVDYSKIVPVLVKAIQELNQKVENQQQTINSLINR